MITQIQLVDPVRGLTSVIKPRTGIAFQGLDVQGAAREVTDPVPGGDGVTDLTAYADQGSVTLTLKLYDNHRALLDELSQFMIPSARPYLQVSDSEWSGDRLIRLRYAGVSAPIVLGTGNTRQAQYQWKVPAGTWEYVAAGDYFLLASAAAVAGLKLTSANGLSVTSAAGVTISASNVTADTNVVVGGTMDVPWVAKFYGPATGPKLYNDTTGQALIFTDALTLAAGEYVLVDSQARTALFGSDPNASRLLYLDFTNTTWFRLKGGQTNLMRYTATSLGTGAQCELQFTPRRMP